MPWPGKSAMTSHYMEVTPPPKVKKNKYALMIHDDVVALEQQGLSDTWHKVFQAKVDQAQTIAAVPGAFGGSLPTGMGKTATGALPNQGEMEQILASYPNLQNYYMVPPGAEMMAQDILSGASPYGTGLGGWDPDRFSRERSEQRAIQHLVYGPSNHRRVTQAPPATPEQLAASDPYSRMRTVREVVTHMVSFAAEESSRAEDRIKQEATEYISRLQRKERMVRVQLEQAERDLADARAELARRRVPSVFMVSEGRRFHDDL